MGIPVQGYTLMKRRVHTVNVEGPAARGMGCQTAKDHTAPI